MKLGRNDACACGSGKKYKKCCGANATATGKATQRPSQDAEAARRLSDTLRRQGRPTEAEAACRQALESHPNSVTLLTMLARLRADAGAFEEAEALLRRATLHDPQSVEAWGGQAYLRQMTPGDTDWLAHAQRLLAEQQLSPRSEVFLRKAVGKYFDDVRDFEAAFTQFQRANELARRYTPKYERPRIAQAVDLIIGAHDDKWLNHSRSDHPSTRPVFVVGMPRSGTTLVEQILASHPDMFGAGELDFWRQAVTTHKSSLYATGCAALLRDLANEYLALLQNLTADALRVVDKMPGNFMHLGLIHAALPGARIIHLQRHPIDTCLSIYFQDFNTDHSYANDLEDLAHYYAQYQRLMDHWRRVTPPGQILDVWYEQLVEDPEAISRKMVEFVGLTWDARCLDFHQPRRAIRTASNWQVRQKIHRSPVARWRHYERFVGPLRHLVGQSAQ